MFENHTAPHAFTETFSCEMDKGSCDPRLAGKAETRFEPPLRLVWWKCVPELSRQAWIGSFFPEGEKAAAGRKRGLAVRPHTTFPVGNNAPGAAGPGSAWQRSAGLGTPTVSTRRRQFCQRAAGTIRSIGPGRHGWELHSEVHVVPMLWSWWVDCLHVTWIAVGRYRTTLTSPSCSGDSAKKPWSAISNFIRDS
jgi:hypothetical protein